mgnify:FL=1
MTTRQKLAALVMGMTEEQAAFVLACMIAQIEQAENEEGAGTHE